MSHDIYLHEVKKIQTYELDIEREHMIINKEEEAESNKLKEKAFKKHYI